MTKKKMLFPLDMGGKKVHTLAELKENVSVANAVEYAQDGRLVKWLRDRGHADMADEIAGLDKDSEEFPDCVCEIVLGNDMDTTVTQQIEKYHEQKAQRILEEAEQKRVEQEQIEEQKHREEEWKNDPPVVFSNDIGVFYVDGNKAICVKKTGYVGTYGIVEEGSFAYYVRNMTGDGGREKLCICSLNLKYGIENSIEEVQWTNVIYLYGIRNHRLYFRKVTNKDDEVVIGEMDLETHQVKYHNYVRSGLAVQLGHIENTCEYRPLIDPYAHHIYCRTTDASGVTDGGYVADFNLETDTIGEKIILKNRREWSDEMWGIGKNAFIVRDFKNNWSPGISRNQEICTYYNLMTNEHKELPALAEEFRKAQTGARHLVLQMCCYQDKIYWLLAVDTKGILYTEYDIYRVMEYDLMTDTSKLIVELNKHYISDEAWPEAKTMFVSENHLYINQISAWNTRSLRISLPDGRVEKLVPVSEQTDSVFIPTFLAKNHGTVARNNKEYRYVNIDA